MKWPTIAALHHELKTTGFSAFLHSGKWPRLEFERKRDGGIDPLLYLTLLPPKESREIFLGRCHKTFLLIHYCCKLDRFKAMNRTTTTIAIRTIKGATSHKTHCALGSYFNIYNFNNFRIYWQLVNLWKTLNPSGFLPHGMNRIFPHPSYILKSEAWEQWTE